MLLAERGAPMGTLDFIKASKYATLSALAGKHVQLAMVIAKASHLLPSQVRQRLIPGHEPGRLGGSFVLAPKRPRPALEFQADPHCFAPIRDEFGFRLRVRV